MNKSLKYHLPDYLRGELSHAGPSDVNRAAELKPLPGVGCSDLLGGTWTIIVIVLSNLA